MNAGKDDDGDETHDTVMDGVLLLYIIITLFNMCTEYSHEVDIIRKYIFTCRSHAYGL